jgi:hypothetical protein
MDVGSYHDGNGPHPVSWTTQPVPVHAPGRLRKEERAEP